MTPRFVILQGGEDVKNKINSGMFQSVAMLSETGSILVIPWSGDSLEREEEYRAIFDAYFHEVGFKAVHFLERSDSRKEIDSKFAEADVIYLPGGDTLILKREIESRSIQFKLRNHKGIIIGNSAGAIVLSKGGYGDSKFYEGFGIVDVIVSVHSKLETFDSLEGRTTPTIGIPEGTWISVRQAASDA